MLEIRPGRFALIDVLPEGITAQVFTDTAGQYFQLVLLGPSR